MIILECEQNTPEWDAARLSIPTSSKFQEIVQTNGKRSKSREKYLFKLAGERLSGEKAVSYYGKSMETGHEREDESCQLYSLVDANGINVSKVGFCFYDERRDRGCSPDRLVGDDGGLETKNAEPHVQLDRLENGWSKAMHFQQVQGSLYISGREWWDLRSYSRGIKPITIRFERDEKFIKILDEEINLFNYDLRELVKKWG